MKAIWNGVVIAESENTVIVEGNHYFPKNAVKDDFLKSSSKTTICPSKGTAHYYTIAVEGKENPDAAWYYPTPKDEAAQIKDRIAFWRGIEVVSD